MVDKKATRQSGEEKEKEEKKKEKEEDYGEKMRKWMEQRKAVKKQKK